MMSATRHLPLLALAVVALLAAAPAAAVRASSDWTDCSGGTAIWKVQHVTLEPSPVKPGDLAKFEIQADSGKDLGGGTVQMIVHYAGMPIWTQTDNLCDKASCPIKKGPTEVKYSQLFPTITPPGSYSVTLNGHSGEDALFCVTIDFMVVPPGAAEVAAQRGPAAGSVPAGVYGVLAGVNLAMAAGFLLAPGLAARLMFRKGAVLPLDPQVPEMLLLTGAGWLVATGALAALVLAAGGRWGRMHPSGADLLRLALAGQSLASVLLFVYYYRLIPAYVWPLELAAEGAVLALPAADLLSRGFSLGALPSQLRRGLAARPARGSLLASAHLLLAVLFPANGFLLFYAPKAPPAGASTFLLAKIAGVVDKSVMPVCQLALKDAAQNGVLRSPAALALNVGTLLAGLVHVRVLLPVLAKDPSGWLLPINLATWLLATFTSAAGLAAGVRPPARASTATAAKTGKQD
ncbi:phosphatidylglycerol phosphatidylinositol transfer [Micractinium conductrix]|uniref:Phosphatidylglycerol phosphatidylinositol transfer n=1 Tax=Micractinium conductrix TaxID=554055 RepID=A0A2P6VSI6_9CHLO|nr:phosphatidylglycerol phosphatidylinositol transfer [Micractinium conductrix]|eukprot:PSC77049.1 phosphatidylglycerol phosphatidylinositol transfer [Micractinium conductrix]